MKANHIEDPSNKFLMDVTTVDLAILDRSGRTDLRRPTLWIISDTATRTILGYSVSSQPPRKFPTAAALNKAINRISRLGDMPGIPNPSDDIKRRRS